MAVVGDPIPMITSLVCLVLTLAQIHNLTTTGWSQHMHLNDTQPFRHGQLLLWLLELPKRFVKYVGNCAQENRIPKIRSINRNYITGSLYSCPSKGKRKQMKLFSAAPEISLFALLPWQLQTRQWRLFCKRLADHTRHRCRWNQWFDRQSII